MYAKYERKVQITTARHRLGEMPRPVIYKIIALQIEGNKETLQKFIREPRQFCQKKKEWLDKVG